MDQFRAASMTLKRIRPEDLSETFVLLFAGVETLDKCYTQTTVKVERELFNDQLGAHNAIQHLWRALESINIFKIFHLTFTTIKMLKKSCILRCLYQKHHQHPQQPFKRMPSPDPPPSSSFVQVFRETTWKEVKQTSLVLFAVVGIETSCGEVSFFGIRAISGRVREAKAGHLTLVLLRG